jgi:hypothetical protein
MRARAGARNRLSARGALEGEVASVETPGDREVASFFAEVRATYVSDPDGAVASRHLAAIAREAELVQLRRTAKPASRRRTMTRNRFLRPSATLGAATLAAVLGTAGLAVAGVDLPDPATKAFERAGISLPNQAGGGQSGEHARSDEVHSVLDATPPSERGCAFGQRVAEAAKGSSPPEHARAACDRSDENGSAAPRKDGNHANTNSNHSQFGRDTAEQARGLGDATTDERRSFGDDTSDDAGQLGGAPDVAPTAERRPESPPARDTTGAPEGTPDGPPDVAPVLEDTPTGPPDGTPGGRP